MARAILLAYKEITKKENGKQYRILDCLVKGKQGAYQKSVFLEDGQEYPKEKVLSEKELNELFDSYETVEISTGTQIE